MAVRPPGDVLDALAVALQRGRPAADGLRWEAPERWHLTLQFLGPLARRAPVIDGLAAAMGERDPFPFRLGGAGAFPNPRRARVVWIGAADGGDAMIRLAAAVSAALEPRGFEVDRPLHPHLTVARLKVPGDVGPVLEALGPDPVGPAFGVGEVVLYESRLSAQGPTYTVLERFPFRNA